MIIVTQEAELINFDKYAKIAPYIGDVDGTVIYAIACMPINTIDDVDDDTSVILGVYNSEAEIDEVLNRLIGAFEIGDNLFNMPEPVTEEVK